MEKTEKTLIITLKRDELAYDIDFITYKVAKVHFMEEAPKVAGEVATDVSDKDFVDRLLTSGLENIKDELRWCCQWSRANSANDIVNGCRKDYDLVLSVRKDWRGSVEVLSSMSHDYLVNYAVFRLLLQVAPNLAPAYASLAESLLHRLYDYMRVNQRIRQTLP